MAKGNTAKRKLVAGNPTAHVPSNGPLDNVNAVVHRTGRLTPPVVGLTNDWRPGDPFTNCKGPIGFVARMIPTVAAVISTRDWFVGKPITPQLIEPHSVEQVLRKARLKAKKRLLYALENESQRSWSLQTDNQDRTPHNYGQGTACVPGSYAFTHIGSCTVVVSMAISNERPLLVGKRPESRPTSPTNWHPRNYTRTPLRHGR